MFSSSLINLCCFALSTQVLPFNFPYLFLLLNLLWVLPFYLHMLGFLGLAVPLQGSLIEHLYQADAVPWKLLQLLFIHFQTLFCRHLSKCHPQGFIHNWLNTWVLILFYHSKLFALIVWNLLISLSNQNIRTYVRILYIRNHFQVDIIAVLYPVNSTPFVP